MPVFAQHDATIQHFEETYYNDTTKIQAVLLVGYWKSNDSMSRRISFLEKPHEIQCRFYDYGIHSFNKNADRNTSVLGILMHWPPNYCHISLIDSHRLECTFIQMGRVMEKRVFIRDENQRSPYKTLDDTIFHIGERIICPEIKFGLVTYQNQFTPNDSIAKIANFLKLNPTIKIEISSHTDSRGTLEGNREISEKRARNICQLLINENKISKDRILFYGAGKSEPIISDKEIDANPIKAELFHQQNRRTEIKIISLY
jgi:outer membrane protein OmpA-like peptidoglycan-associated protein